MEGKGKLMEKTRKGLLAVLTALALAAGIFAGAGVPAEASKYDDVKIKALDVQFAMPEAVPTGRITESRDQMQQGLKLDVTVDVSVRMSADVAWVTTSRGEGNKELGAYNGRKWYVPKEESFLPDTEYGVVVMVGFTPGSGEWPSDAPTPAELMKDAQVTINGRVTKLAFPSGGLGGYAVLEFEGETGASIAPAEAPAKAEETHAHSYSWVTVQEASAGQDGLEEYRCSCGDVLERNLIPACTAAVKGLCDSVKNAPQNGVVRLDTGRLYTLSDDIVRKLAERTDVTIEVTFEYQRKAYRMTIPAGVDYSALLAEKAGFYGYFYFAGAVGAVIEEV